MMNFLLTLNLVSVIVCVITGVVVFYQNAKSQLSRVFLWLCLGMAYWSYIDYAAKSAESYERAYFWINMYFFWPLVSAAGLHMILLLVDKAAWFKKPYIWLLVYAPAVFFSFSQIAWKGLEVLPLNRDQGYWDFASNKSVVYLTADLWLVVVFIFVFIMLIHFLLTTVSYKKKRQIQFIMAGVFVSFFFGTIADIIPNIVDGLPHYPLTPVAFSMMLMIWGYAIWKYELFVLNTAVLADNIVSIMSDMLIIVSTDGKIINVNKSVEKILGYPDNKLINVDMSDLAEITNLKNINEAIVSKGAVNDVTVVLLTKDGHQVEAALSGAPAYDRIGALQGFVYTLRDTTERRKAEESRLQQEKLESVVLAEKEKLRALSDVIASVSHEINSPLLAINIGTGLMKRYVDYIREAIDKHDLFAVEQKQSYKEKTNDYYELLNMQHESLEKISKHIKNLKSYVKLQEKQEKLININSELMTIIDIINFKLPSHVTVQQDLAVSLPAIMGFAAELNQVFVSLIYNAIEAIPDTQRGTIIIRTSRTNGLSRQIKVDVIDNGTGMPEEISGKLFSSQVTTKGERGGSGLSMLMCKQVVEKHSGEIVVSSVSGKGTTVTVLL